MIEREEMITYYDNLMDWVERGHAFRIDLKTKSMQLLSNEKCIENGDWFPDADLIHINGICDEKDKTKFCLDIIEELYHNYKYSTPTEKSEKYKQRNYFKALSPDEMTDEELVNGEDRNVARAKLEGFILCASLAGYLTWDEKKMGKWFYQGKDKDLVILREWIDERRSEE